MERPLLITRARIATFDETETVIDDGAILIDRGRIAALGRDAAARAPRERDEHDARGRVVIPGLVNAHTHLYSTLARGMALMDGRSPPADFRAILEEIWWPLDRALDEDDVYVSAVLGLLELARAGVTCVVDHHASERAIEGSLDLIARAASEVGLRVATCFETTDRDGPDVARRGINENVRFARAVAKDVANRGAELGGVAARAASFGLHASLTLSDATLDAARAAAKDAGLSGFHVHVAESRFDPEDSLAKSRARTVERLARAGILGPKTIAAHCVHVDDREVAILKETRTLVVTNPSSNRNNAVGKADVARLVRAGVRVALGTDGMSGDVLGEAAQAFLQAKDVAQDPRAGWEEAHAMLFRGDRDVARELFGAPLGAIELGGPADLAILDYDPWTPLDATNALGHVLYGGLGAKVRDVLCGGRFVLRDGAPCSRAIDVERLAARGRERARALWSRRSRS